MKYHSALIKFMKICLLHEKIVQSWGINQIQVSDISLSFHVSGYNYTGIIIITTTEDEQILIINSATDYIGSANCAIDTIKMLDKYIESNEEKYQGLLNSIIN